MKNKFKEIKEEFISLLQGKSPCAPEYRKVLGSETEEQLLEIIKNNLPWCSVNRVCPDSFLAKFTPEILLAAGVANVGEGNTGLANTGYSNTGYSNTGYSNTGYSNTGDWNTGAFCTGTAPFPMFNKPSDWTEQDFKDSYAYELLHQIDTKMWVPLSHMTEEEKQAYPSCTTAEGYLKDIPFKEAFQNRWHNWDNNAKSAFTSLPNFDWEIFTEITGVVKPN